MQLCMIALKELCKTCHQRLCVLSSLLIHLPQSIHTSLVNTTLCTTIHPSLFFAIHLHSLIMKLLSVLALAAVAVAACSTASTSSSSSLSVSLSMSSVVGQYYDSYDSDIDSADIDSADYDNDYSLDSDADIDSADDDGDSTPTELESDDSDSASIDSADARDQDRVRPSNARPRERSQRERLAARGIYVGRDAFDQQDVSGRSRRQRIADGAKKLYNGGKEVIGGHVANFHDRFDNAGDVRRRRQAASKEKHTGLFDGEYTKY